jgi:DNA-binding transcriptional ArsR family regulator
MGVWKVSADTMAGGRFVISPLAETLASLIVLAKAVTANPGEHAWLNAHLPAYRALLEQDSVTARLVVAALGTRRWIADFITPPPSDRRPGEEETPVFADELAVVRATAPDQAIADLRVALGGPLPDDLNRSDLAERMAEMLDWVWTQTVLPYWERRRRILEADILARTSRLSQGGWAAALNEMRQGMGWLGDGTLQINVHDYPPKDISGGKLFFVPITPQVGGWVSWAEPYRYAIVYPCTAPLADAGHRPVPEAMARLLGPARAAVLVLLETPMSTTQVVAVTGQKLGSVGRHLKVLLDAGLVHRYRVGRSVLYQRTVSGDILLGAEGWTPSAGQ